MKLKKNQIPSKYCQKKKNAIPLHFLHAYLFTPESETRAISCRVHYSTKKKEYKHKTVYNRIIQKSKLFISTSIFTNVVIHVLPLFLKFFYIHKIRIKSTLRLARVVSPRMRQLILCKRSMRR